LEVVAPSPILKREGADLRKKRRNKSLYEERKLYRKKKKLKELHNPNSVK